MIEVYSPYEDGMDFDTINEEKAKEKFNEYELIDVVDKEDLGVCSTDWLLERLYIYENGVDMEIGNKKDNLSRFREGCIAVIDDEEAYICTFGGWKEINAENFINEIVAREV